MNNAYETSEDLIAELEYLRRRVAELETAQIEHIQADEMLRKFSKVINQTADQVLITDSQGVIEYVNPAFEIHTGYSRQEVIGQKPSILKSGRHDQEFYRHLWQTITSGAVYRGVLINKKKNGELYYEEKTITPIKDPTGHVTHFVSTSKDITERKQAEAALRKSEANYRELADSIADIFFAVDKNFCLTYWNKVSEELTGISTDEAVSKSLTELLPYSIAETITELFANVLDSQQSIATEIEYKLNNRYRYFDVTAYPANSGISVFVKEITERKWAEKSLQQRNRELALINKASQAFVSTLDLDQVLTTILEGVQHLLEVTICSTWLVDPETNELVCRQVGNAQGEAIVGWRLSWGQGLVGWAAKHGESLIVADAQQDKRYFAGIEKAIHLKLHSIICVPLKVKNNVIGILQAMDSRLGRFNQSDVTLLESLAAAAAIAIDNARLYNQAQHDAQTRAILLQEVNHRVKNNLSAIIGLLYAEQRHILQYHYDEQTVESAYQKTMSDLINRVQGLATVHNMLSASEWSPLPLSQLAQQVIHAALKMLPSNQSVVVKVSPVMVKVTSNQAHDLALVINELTINTVKHATRSKNPIEIFVDICLKDDNVSLTFKDNGPGYPPHVQKNNKSDKGIGFELVQNVVRRGLRGTLSLHNDDGAVATIQFKSKIPNQEIKETLPWRVLSK